MTRLCLLLLAALAGCEPMTPDQAAQLRLDRPFSEAHVEHDDTRAVTCWISNDSRAGLSCLPDWMLARPDPKKCLIKGIESDACWKLSRENAGNERQLSPHEQESEPTPATAPGRWDEERYSL